MSVEAPRTHHSTQQGQAPAHLHSCPLELNRHYGTRILKGLNGGNSWARTRAMRKRNSIQLDSAADPTGSYMATAIDFKAESELLSQVCATLGPLADHHLLDQETESNGAATRSEAVPCLFDQTQSNAPQSVLRALHHSKPSPEMSWPSGSRLAQLRVRALELIDEHAVELIHREDRLTSKRPRRAVEKRSCQFSRGPCSGGIAYTPAHRPPSPIPLSFLCNET